jgi:CHAT domain-containing protein
MRSFYGNLSSGLSKTQALRNAKIAMMNSSYSDPYYWAGFILSGNASSKIKFEN